MAKKKPAPKKKPPQKDTQQLARSILDAVAPEKPAKAEPEKNPAAVALGRLGGLKGGVARAKKLTKTQRSQIAQKAAAARWGKKRKKKPSKDLGT